MSAIDTYSRETHKDMLEFNPLIGPAEKIFKSFELTLNRFDYVPRISQHSGHARICVFTVVAICSLFRAIFDFLLIITHQHNPLPEGSPSRDQATPNAAATAAAVGQFFSPKHTGTSFAPKTIHFFSKLIDALSAQPKDGCSLDVAQLHTSRARHLNLAIHAIVNIIRGYAITRLPVGLGGLAFFIYDYRNRYEYHDPSTPKNTGFRGVI